MCELILLVGIPASGKSTFREANFPDAAVVCPDSFIGYTKENPRQKPQENRMGLDGRSPSCPQNLRGNSDDPCVQSAMTHSGVP